MNYGQQCGNSFNKRVEVSAISTDTVWVDILHIDNGLRGWKNREEIFSIRGNGPPPSDSRHAITYFDSTPPSPTFFSISGYNEPKTNQPSNPWGFRWRISRVNERGVEVWAEVFEIRCDQDQSGGWDKRVFNWDLVVKWINSGPRELSGDESRSYDEHFRRPRDDSFDRDTVR